MILLTGATGTTGRDIVGELKGCGGVRVLVRDAARAGFVRDGGLQGVRFYNCRERGAARGFSYGLIDPAPRSRAELF